MAPGHNHSQRRGERFLLAVDPSLSGSGWALFSVASARPLALGLVTPPPASVPLALRLAQLQSEVDSLLHGLVLGERDYLICEGPAPLVKNPLSALKVEHVRGIFETIARSRGLTVPGRLNPRTVQTELLGMRGRQLARREVKEHARAAAGRLFGPELSSLPVSGVSAKRVPQDVIDALLIGAVAVARVQLSLRVGGSICETFEGLADSLRRSTSLRAGYGGRSRVSRRKAAGG